MFFEEYQSGNFDCTGNRVLSLSEWKKRHFEEDDAVIEDDDEDLSEWYELFNIAPERP